MAEQDLLLAVIDTPELSRNMASYGNDLLDRSLSLANIGESPMPGLNWRQLLHEGVELGAFRLRVMRAHMGFRLAPGQEHAVKHRAVANRYWGAAALRFLFVDHDVEDVMIPQLLYNLASWTVLKAFMASMPGSNPKFFVSVAKADDRQELRVGDLESGQTLILGVPFWWTSPSEPLKLQDLNIEPQEVKEVLPPADFGRRILLL